MTLSFEGAEGFGAEATGGRGGQVIYVTNSNNSGVGSLRWAIEDVSGPRTIVFAVNKVNLTTNIQLLDGDVTIAGQTAGGVEVTGGTIRFQDSNVIMRGMIFRAGDSATGFDPGNRDSIGMGAKTRDVSDIMIDHNSFEWALDENAAIWIRTSDVTFSNNIFAEGLYQSKLGTTGGYGMLFDGGNGTVPNEIPQNISVIYNLFAFNHARNPWVKHGEGIEIINNYMYAPDDFYRTISLGHDNTNDYAVSAYMSVNVINNYLEAGPNTRTDSRSGINVHNGADADYYISGNRQFRSNGQEYTVQYHGPDTGDVINSPAFAGSGVTIINALDVPDYVLANAGANPTNRDEVDQRIIDLVENHQGRVVNSVAEAGGWGARPNFVAPTDTDRDGMPDWFENQFGFDRTRADSNGDRDGDGFTNLEEYINGLIDGFNLNGTSGGAGGSTSGGSTSGGSTSGGGTTTPPAPTPPAPTPPPPTPIDSGTLRIIDYRTDQAIATVSAGGTLDAALLDNPNLAIEYVAGGGGFGSVRLEWQGGLASRIQNAEPYALFGDNNGDFKPSTIGALFPDAGGYDLKLTFYSKTNGQGTVLGTETISFSVAADDGGSGGSTGGTRVGESTDPVASPAPVPVDQASGADDGGTLRIIDYRTDQAIATVSAGGTLDAALLDNPNLAIEYVADGNSFGSVRLEWQDGLASRIQNAAPYALFGDNNGDFKPSTIGALFPDAGGYDLKLTFYSKTNGQGTVLGTETISFSVAGDGGSGGGDSAVAGEPLFALASLAPESVDETQDSVSRLSDAPFVKTINVGGGDFIAGDGTVFSADPGISSGSALIRDLNPSDVAGTQDDAFFRDFATGNFSYDIAVPRDGDYQVTLFLAEPSAWKAEQRVFDVDLEGRAIGSFNDIDIFGQTGAKWKALTLTETVHVSDGVLDIDVIASSGQGILNGIAVHELFA